MKKALEINNLSFSYGKTPVLKDVNISINHGEFIGVFGPNGGGKTTLLKLIMGALEPTEGSIKVFGKPPKEMEKAIGYVPQSLAFDKQFPISVLEVVLMGRLSKLNFFGKYRKEDKRAAIEVLEQVELVDYKDQAFASLSGGQRQRVLIARALLSNPKILLLDEPTACLDVKSGGKIYHFLNKLASKITILMVTHDLPEIVDHAKRVLCVHGSVVAMHPKDVCEHFSLGLYHVPIVKACNDHRNLP